MTGLRGTVPSSPHPDLDLPERLLLPEARARRLLLAQALETADPQGLLVGLPERSRIDADTLAATGDPAKGQPLDLRAWLGARTDRLLDLLGHRRPALAALASPPAWAGWLAAGLPLLALLAGGALDRIDNPHQVNLLSPPLLAFVAWNLVVYLGLALTAVRPVRWRGTPPAWPATRGGRHPVARAFQAAWWRVAGPLEGQRWRRLLHLAAAAWGVGVVLSLLAGGVVREYRVGWESTLLDLPQVHALLRALYAPVLALLPLQPFSLDEVARLHFGDGAGVGREAARRWVWMTVALVALVVVLPRLALAAWAHLHARRLARALAVDLREPPFDALLAAVRPARLRIAVLPAPPALQPLLRQLLWQLGAGQGPLPPEGPAGPLLDTPRGDLLAVAGPQPAGADLLLLACADTAELAEALPALRAAGRPVLALVAGPEAEAAALLRGHGLPAAVLPLQALPACAADGRWLEALQAVLPLRAAGLQRLAQAWADRDAARLARAMDLLASDLLAVAADAEVATVPQMGVRQLVLRGDREAQQQARAEALERLAARWLQRQQGTDARLSALHGLGPEAVQQGTAAAAPAPAWQVLQGVDRPQASLAGAAGGAAMGATVDLVTGGLTLGAASALGAVLGGGAALAAATWRNRGVDGAGLKVRADGAVLQALAAHALLRWLQVQQAGRPAMGDPAQAAALARGWVEAHADALAAAWAAPDGPGSAQRLAALLEEGAQAVLGGLHGPLGAAAGSPGPQRTPPGG